MRMYDLITKKKGGGELTTAEINEMIREYTVGNIPDYQMSSMLMAICWRGCTDEETAALTAAISNSGDTVNLDEFGTLSVDKHSTGGVGDKTTLIVAPIAASLGCKVAKMSGRGLGHTGGTVDKLESFHGYDTALTPEKFFEQVRNHGIAVIGQSGNLAPADKKLYALRDVTATVNSIPLIASSIMGKKLAAGAHSIVLDVKCGSGAFTKTPEEARALAEAMVSIGKLQGRRVSALITNMDIPLGNAIGNILEVKEAISVLRGAGPLDLVEICKALAAQLAQLSLGITHEDAAARVDEALSSGAAYEKFLEWIEAQGGSRREAECPELLKKPKFTYEVRSKESGYISHMDAEKIGLAGVSLGAGRATKDDPIDHSAGIVLNKKTGDYIEAGELLCTLYTDREDAAPRAAEEILDAVCYSTEKPKFEKLIIDYVI